MSRKSRFCLAAIALVVGTVFCLSPLSVLAAPPIPPTPTSVSPVPTAPLVYPMYHVVRWGENLTRIARYYGTTVWAIAQANGIWNVDYIWAGQVLLIPGWSPGPVPGPQYYIVQPGDTLGAIAWRFGTTVWMIAQANGIWNPNLIYVGQRLYIA